MKFLSTVFITLFIFTTSVSTYAQTSLTVDTEKSKIEWLGKKFSGEHSGTIKLESGTLEFNDNSFAGGTFTINMSTILCTDLSGEYKTKLEGHLSAPDFFDVAKYPNSTFKVTKVTKTEDTKYEVTGNLTIKGISHPNTFELTVDKHHAHGKMIVDRTQYGIKYKSKSFFSDIGDKFIYDDFTLTIHLSY